MEDITKREFFCLSEALQHNRALMKYSRYGEMSYTLGLWAIQPYIFLSHLEVSKPDVLLPTWSEPIISKTLDDAPPTSLRVLEAAVQVACKEWPSGLSPSAAKPLKQVERTTLISYPSFVSGESRIPCCMCHESR